MSDHPDDPDLHGGVDLPEYEPQAAVVLTDAERWPTLTPDGAARLDAVRTHPSAPAWVHAAGDRLDAEGIVAAATPLPTGDWLPDHLAAARELPAYRGIRDRLRALDDFPLVTRDDLLADVSRFVPLGADLDGIVQATSSGTTGRSLVLPEHPVVIARTFHLLHRLAADAGVTWEPDPARMALANVIRQRQAFTYASVLSGFRQATMARLNHDPAQWPEGAAGRAAFLLDHDPQAYSGTPTSLAELLDPRLVAGLHPLVIFSGAMELSAALRDDLRSAYRVPVIDVYGLQETGPIAARIDDGPMTVLDRRVHVEVLDPDGRPTEARGEIVVTAGENPLLPLVRYRTGDHARLTTLPDGRLALDDLEGRAATVFRAADGRGVPSVDLVQHLQAASVRAWSVVQDASGDVVARMVGGDTATAAARIAALLGREVRAEVLDTVADLGEGKPRRFRSDATVG